MRRCATAIYAMPAFHDKDGKFSRQMFEGVLRNNGLTEQGFVALMRDDLAQRQLLEAVAAGAVAPQAEAVPLYEEQFEKRSADMAEFPFASETAPAPTDAELQRWYDNHPWLYSSPELRRIKAIVLSPQTLAKDIPISDDGTAGGLRAAQGGVRDAGEALGRGDLGAGRGQGAGAGATNGAAAPIGTAMQEAAQKDGASAVALDDATQQEFPDADLAKAVFAAPTDAVSDPVKGALGWFVLKVTKLTPGSEKTFDEVKDALRNRMLAEKATDLMYDRANKIDNLAGQRHVAGPVAGRSRAGRVAGTLDCQGQHQGRHPGADPRSAGAEGRDRRRRLPGAEGRSAATDRGADAVDRRLGVLCAERRGHHSAGRQAVRRGEGQGDRRTGRPTSSATQRKRRRPSC